MASTHSPTRKFDESPSLTAGRSRASTFSTAMSLRSSDPTSLACISRRSNRRTIISAASWTTWKLVMMYPSRAITNPEPDDALSCLGRRSSGICSRNLRKNSYIGLSSGMSGRPNICGISPPSLRVTLMFTTDGELSSASRVKSGNSRAANAGAVNKSQAMAVATTTAAVAARNGTALLGPGYLALVTCM